MQSTGQTAKMRSTAMSGQILMPRVAPFYVRVSTVISRNYNMTLTIDIPIIIPILMIAAGLVPIYLPPRKRE